MMMVILSSLKCVPSHVRDNPRYVGDHVIRHYRPLGLATLLRDLQLPQDTPEFEILGGIGRLVLRHGSEVWEPVIPGMFIIPRPASLTDQEARRSLCASCVAFSTARCTASGCGCAGEGKLEILSSKCPLGRWPAPSISPESE